MARPSELLHLNEYGELDNANLLSFFECIKRQQSDRTACGNSFILWNTFTSILERTKDILNNNNEEDYLPSSDNYKYIKFAQQYANAHAQRRAFWSDNLLKAQADGDTKMMDQCQKMMTKLEPKEYHESREDYAKNNESQDMRVEIIQATPENMKVKKDANK